MLGVGDSVISLTSNFPESASLKNCHALAVIADKSLKMMP